jgi:hypothetical protein
MEDERLPGISKMASGEIIINEREGMLTAYPDCPVLGVGIFFL